MRLVLSHEQLRMRDEVPKKLEESDGLAARHFQSVMYEAQIFLRNTFGTELFELTTRAAAGPR